MGDFLRAEGLAKRYGAVVALRGVDLSVGKGSFLLLLGPNGAGKSTLLGILAGRIRPTSGSVLLAGTPLKGDEEARARTGLVAHASFLYPGLTAWENLLLYARLYRLAEPEARCGDVLRLLGLWERRGERVGGFSRGMVQRTAIARSLLHDPDLLIWDEPFSGLDLVMAMTLREVLVSLKERGRTILLATHDLAPVAGLADRVMVLARGKVAHCGPGEKDLAGLYLSVVGVGGPGGGA